MDKVYEFIKHKKRGNMKNISDKYNGSLVNSKQFLYYSYKVI